MEASNEGELDTRIQYTKLGSERKPPAGVTREAWLCQTPDLHRPGLLASSGVC